MASKNLTSDLFAVVFILVSIGILLASHASSRSIEHEVSMVERHEQWMAHHGRIYKDAAEKARRFNIFKDNVKRIKAFNMKKNKHKYTLGTNKFSDLTVEEFQASHTGYYIAPTNLSTAFQPTTTQQGNNTFSSEDVPNSVDWRNQGAVTDVKDQGSCGCCWAFSAVAAIEGMNAIASGELVSLSEQELVDCVTYNTPNLGGCGGGFMTNAFEFVQQNGGIAKVSDYTYTSGNGQVENACQAQSYSNAVQIGSYKSVAANDENALLEAVAQQPVSVAIDAQNFKDYHNGIYSGPCESDTQSLNHAVTLVGYGTDDDGTDYWMIKNSWGTTWGEQGYMRIHRNSGVQGGMCGLAMYPSYPVATSG